MSKYTTQVRWIVETKANDSSLSTLEKIQKAAPLIFNFDFPIWDEKDRLALETKILLNYYTKEIGLETVALWQLFLQAKMLDIMPYYVQLHKYTTDKIDFLEDYNRKEVYKGEGGSEKNGSSESNFSSGSDAEHNSTNNSELHSTNSATSNSNTLNSDLPQAAFTQDSDYGTDNSNTNETASGKTDSTNNTTVHDTTESTSHSNSDSTANEKTQSTEEFVRTITGRSGARSPAELILQYRQTIIDIDSMIIKDLSDLFLKIY